VPGPWRLAERHSAARHETTALRSYLGGTKGTAAWRWWGVSTVGRAHGEVEMGGAESNAREAAVACGVGASGQAKTVTRGVGNGLWL
jgi:hypothetical protein